MCNRKTDCTKATCFLKLETLSRPRTDSFVYRVKMVNFSLSKERGEKKSHHVGKKSIDLLHFFLLFFCILPYNNKLFLHRHTRKDGNFTSTVVIFKVRKSCGRVASIFSKGETKRFWIRRSILRRRIIK